MRLFQVCLLVFLACIALSGVTSDPVSANGTLIHRLGNTKNDTTEADPNKLQEVDLEWVKSMKTIKNIPNFAIV